jgi:Mg-chelatase subunit ChlD
MTDDNYTALLLIIDRSGSMSGIRDDMVGGLQTLLAQQASEPGMLTVDVLTFDDVLEVTHTMADPASVVIELDPRGSTALFDAIGFGVQGFGKLLGDLPEHARPGTVQVVVVTDGHENASREFTADTVRKLVTQQKEKYGWDFVFLGANQDAVLTGGRLGFDRDSSMTFDAAPAAVAMTNESLSRYVGDVRKKNKRGFSDDERGSARS